MGSIRRTFVAHVPLYACTILFAAITATILDAYNVTPKFAAAWFFLTIFLFVLAVIGCFSVFGEMIRLVYDGFPPTPLQRIGNRLLARLCTQDRIGNVVHSTFGLAPILIIYAAFKGSIPLVHPFAWDATFSQMDNAIGAGHQPWQILQPILGYAPITTLLSYAYYAWFFVLYGAIAGQAFSSHCGALRMRFLISLTFAFFIAGCVLATIFSSAGPCYFAHVEIGTNPYTEQIAYLHGIESGSLPSVLVQDGLWKAFASGRFEHGISAMPSMHVTIAVLIGLFGWRKGGACAFALPPFAALIVLGSVHLAWHYAVDAIAGIGLAALFWYAAGRMVEAWDIYLEQSTIRGQILHGTEAQPGTQPQA